MKLTIKETKDVPLLSRKEVTAQLSYSGPTPNRDTVLKAMASEAKSKPELVVLQKIMTKYGVEEASVEAHIYTDEAKMKEIEPEYLFKRKESKPKEAPKEDAPVKAKTEEKPKEETPAEEKKVPVEEKPTEPPKEAPKEGE